MLAAARAYDTFARRRHDVKVPRIGVITFNKIIVSQIKIPERIFELLHLSCLEDTTNEQARFHDANQ
jgi:hypothetical protein